jgi:IclR family transcriptional regulator, pca regulon regulatory protein
MAPLFVADEGRRLTRNGYALYAPAMAKLKDAPPKGKARSASQAPIFHTSLSPDPEMAEDKNYIAALARGLSVIRAFAYQRDQLTLAEISRLVDLPRATVRRCLITLNALNYVDSDGKYFSLTPKVLTLSQAYFSSSPLPHIARPYIEQVSASVGESCSVSVLASDEVIYIARSSRKRSASIQREVGVNLPAYCTSMGRVLLSALAPDELDTYFRRVVLRKFNANTVTDETALRTILDQVRHDDYATIDGELEPNLRAIAVPVRNMSGRIVAACHISTDASRVSKEKMQASFLPPLRDAVANIRRALVG